MASEQLAKIIETIRNRPKMKDVPIEGWREGMEERARSFRPYAGVKFTPVDAGGVPSEWAEPESGAERVLVYYHGGGYAMGSIDTHRVLCSNLALACDARVLNVDYRLGPEHPFPAAVEDAVAAYRWVLEHGTDPELVTMGGDSAGGGLTVAALLQLRDAGDALPASAVLLSPWTDLTLSGDSVTTKLGIDPMVLPGGLKAMAKWYLGDQDPSHPLASPVFADLAGLPPMLIQVGTAELLLDDSTRLAANIEAAGGEAELSMWEDMIHVWQSLAPVLPEGQEAVDAIGEFVKARVAISS